MRHHGASRTLARHRHAIAVARAACFAVSLPRGRDRADHNAARHNDSGRRRRPCLLKPSAGEESADHAASAAASPPPLEDRGRPPTPSRRPCSVRRAQLSSGLASGLIAFSQYVPSTSSLASSGEPNERTNSSSRFANTCTTTMLMKTSVGHSDAQMTT